MKLRIALALVAAGSCFGQVAFEVASIKPSEAMTPQKMMAGKMNIGMKVDGARVDIGYLGLTELITMAYRLKRYQLQGPDWMSAQRFDIQAKLPAGATKDQVPEMLQALLVERFGLKFHRDTKEQAMYALVVGKGGSKLKEADPDPDPATAVAEGAPVKGTQTFTMGAAGGQTTVRMAQGGGGAVVTTGGSGGMGGARMEMGSDGMMHMELKKITMTAFSEMITRFVDKPVMDQTELKGNYKVTLDLAMSDMMGAARAAGAGMGVMMGGALGGGAGVGAGAGGGAGEASDPSGGSIFQSVQKMGLKLEPKKAAVEILVVDHLDKKPTEN